MFKVRVLAPQHASVAQPVEQLICNQEVAGSNPAGGSQGERMTEERLVWLLVFVTVLGGINVWIEKQKK